MNPSPPRWAEKLLARLLKDDLLEEVLGDLEEKFYFTIKRTSHKKAKLIYWYQVINYLRPFALKSIQSKNSNYNTMLKHNLLISYRSFLKDKSTFLINLVGLSSALTCAILIYSWIKSELDIDQFHDEGDRIYTLYQEIISPNYQFTIRDTPYPLANALEDEIHEVEVSTSVQENWFRKKEGIVGNGNIKVKASEFYIDENFFKVFSYPIIKGNKSYPLENDASVIISEKVAHQIFKDEDPIGKTISWDQTRTSGNYIVSAVFKEQTSISSKKFDLLFSLSTRLKSDTLFNDWANSKVVTYTRLKPNTTIASFKANIKNLLSEKQPGEEVNLYAQKFEEMYLYNTVKGGDTMPGRMLIVSLFGSIAVLILVVAGINFMNLTTAKASRRIKEIGVKKSIGASRKALMGQYFSESILISCLSLIVAVIISIGLFPAFSQLVEKNLAFPINAFSIITLIVITLGVGVFSGIYPAFYLSSFKPVDVLKGRLTSTFGDHWIRKGLVVSQFIVAILLIIGVIVVSDQLKFIHKKDLGFDRKNLLVFEYEADTDQGYQAFLSEIKNIPGVINASGINQNLVSSYGMTNGVNWEGKEESQSSQFITLEGGYDYLLTMGVKLKEGEYYSKEGATNKIIINEAAAKFMKLKDPIGKRVILWGETRQIIGVAKDFHFASLYEDIRPALILMNPSLNKTVVRIDSENKLETIEDLESVYHEHRPGILFSFSFIDDEFAATYKSEDQVAKLAELFALIAILISCLGLLGLTIFSLEKRAKEISIRRVLGAPSLQMVFLLSKEFSSLILVAMVVATPIGYFLTNSWLQNFADAMELTYWQFIYAGLLTLVIALTTIGIQTYKAIRINPVESLKSE